MKPRLDPAALAKTRLHEYVVRFLFGGLVTAATGVVAHHFGPGIGGLFLAFPAILPASLTLVQEHDGREQAVDDARGACLGGLGLAAFAAVVWSATMWRSGIVLVAATLAWLVVSVVLWSVVFGKAWSNGHRRSIVPGLSGRPG